MNRSAEWLARGFVAVLGLYATLERFVPRLVRDDWHAGDLAQHVWWTARFADPGLFPGDFIADFFSLPLFAPIGYQAIYRLGVPFADPQIVAESIPLVLGPLLIFLAWRAGRAAAGGSLVGAVVGACLAVRLLVYMHGGLPRTFALPILALAMVGLLERRLWVLGVAGLAAALFYPPVSVNLGLTAAVVLGVDWARSRRLPSGWPALAVLGALAVGIVLWAYAQPLPEDVGPKVTAEQARAMPEFHRGGRSRFFVESALETYLGKGRGGYGLRLEQSALIALGVALSARLAPGAVPLAVWALLGTGMLAHALAHLTLFAMHLPARYMMYALPIFLLLFLSAVAARLAGRLRARFPLLANPVLLGLAGLAFLVNDGTESIDNAIDRAGRPAYVNKETTLAFLATLPKDALVAAHPEDANSIPLRSKRSVLASKEVALPYYLGYYRRLSERMEAGLRAFYAHDWEGVDALYERYGVDVMVVYRGRFQVENRDFNEPFRSRMADLTGADRRAYVLRDPPDDRVLYRHGEWYVVRLGPPRPGYEPAVAAEPPTARRPAAAGTR